jgi:hypothetical protein
MKQEINIHPMKKTKEMEELFVVWGVFFVFIQSCLTIYNETTKIK